MKKLLLIMMMLAGVMFVKAQNYIQLNVDTIPQQANYSFCSDSCDGVVVYRHNMSYGMGFNWDVHYLNYNPYEWYWADASINYHFNSTDSIVLTTDNPDYVDVDHYPYCDELYEIECRNIYGNSPKFIFITFVSAVIQNPFSDSVIWKRQYEEITLNSYNEEEFESLWSSGETNPVISITNPGLYSVYINRVGGCTSDSFATSVRDNVELYRATVDLETNLNKTTWQVTEEQADYITDVKVYRDGLLVGTVPYEQGYYLDNIGSDNAARNYRIVGVSVEGEDCPIESYEKGTIHTTYYEDVNGNLNMTWNVPYVEEGAQGTLTYFQICKYDPNTGEITVVDQVNASITDYTCGVNQFDGGYAVIAAVFNDGRGVEELSFSNLTTDILSIGENGETGFSIYPNPAKDRVIVEGTGTMIVTNTLGQTVMVKEINGKATIELQQGLYFVKMNGVTRKIVME